MNKSININELATLIKAHEPIQLVDVRSPGEYAAGHVPQAINIPLEQLEARFADLTEGQVAVLCQSGTRAGMACELLNRHHDGLLLVQGGTQAWIDAGKPIVSTTGNKWSLERQVRLLAGLIVLVGTSLAVTVNASWVFLAMFVGAGLTFAGITNICGMALLLGKLPWNKANNVCLTPAEVTK